MGTIKRFEDLEIWKLSRELCKEVYHIVESTHLKNNFKLEFIQFLSIAKASCGETRSQLYRVYDRNFISQEKFETLIEVTEH